MALTKNFINIKCELVGEKEKCMQALHSYDANW